MNYAQEFNIDDQTTYLNHGSFGPSPKCVREKRQEWTERLEQQPMRFFCREMEQFLWESAEAVAKFLHTKPARLALVDNATMGMNVAAASVELEEGDEVLLTDHEYGAVRNIWQERCRRTGARLVSVELPFPLNDDGVVDAIATRINDRTKVLVISHVTSPTAAILPVKRVCHLARERGVITAIDGPHAIAMLDVRLDDLGCDFYCASCHKWLCAPFGTGFLYVHPRHHHKVKCPMVSWGGSISGRPASWQDRTNWLGTRDPAGQLTLPTAIEFMQNGALSVFRSHAHELVCNARQRLLSMEGVGPFCTATEDDVVSMCAVELPQPEGWEPGYHGHPDPLQVELRDKYGIETPVASWNGKRFLRVSAHLYNSQADVDRLVEALSETRNLLGSVS